MLYVLTSSTRGVLLITRDNISASRAFDKAAAARQPGEIIELADYDSLGSDFQRIGIMRIVG